MKELAIAYCRVSSKKQEKKGLSLDAQEDYIREWIKNNGHDLVKVFKVQESARVTERKHLNEALKYCVDNGIKQILVSDSDRWTRNRELDMEARKFLKENGISVYLIQDRRVIPDFKSAAEKFGHNVKVDVDSYVSDIIREKSLRGVKQKLEKNEYPGACPLGYKSVSKTEKHPHMNIQTEVAPTVKKFLELFNSGKFTVQQMIKLARDIGLKPQRKEEFTKGTLARLIKSRYYYGEFEWTHPWIDAGAPKIYKNKTAGFEPIITKKMWEQNQAILKKRQTNFKGRNTAQHVFNNLITCGQCGGLVFGFQPSYKVKWKTKKGIQTKVYKYNTHYICNKNSYYTSDGRNNVPEKFVDKETLTVKENITYIDDYSHKEEIWLKKGTSVKKQKCNQPYFLESEIEEMLMNEIGLIKFNKKHWQKVKANLFKDETKDFVDYEIRSLRSEITNNEIRLDEMYEDYRKGVIDVEFHKTRRERIVKRQEEAKARLEELEEARETFDEKIGKAIEIIDSLQNWEKIFNEADNEKKNQLIRLLTIKVSTQYIKKELKGKIFEGKSISVRYEPEVEELLMLGILEESKKEKKERDFNGTNFRHG